MQHIGLIYVIYKKSMVITMDIKQLHYFLTICEERQITAAARKLHMAQPPLSYQLKMLEEELGVELVKRGRHQIQLTEAGELLRDRAQQILRLCDSTRQEIAHALDSTRHQLTIGIVTSAHGTFLQQGICNFHKAYPNVDFILKEGNTFQIMERLEKGSIDIGIVRTPFPHANFHTYPLLREGMLAAVHQDEDPFDEGPIQVSQLQQQPLVYYERYAAMLEEIFLEAGFLPHTFCLNQDARTTLLWAKSRLGIAIVPRSALMLVDTKDLHLHELQDSRLQTQITMITLKDHYVSDIAEAFLSYYAVMEK